MSFVGWALLLDSRHSGATYTLQKSQWMYRSEAWCVSAGWHQDGHPVCKICNTFLEKSRGTRLTDYHGNGQ